MANAEGSWNVLPHRPIEKLSDRVWRVEGDLPNMPLKRVMTIARMTTGELVIHNAIALEESAMSEIEAWGPVAFILVPNAFHRMDAPAFATRYPKAKVLCPPAARPKVAKVVRVDGTYADFPSDPAVALELLEGVGDQEGVMSVRDASGGTLVFNDVLFNAPHVPGAKGFVLRHITASTGGPRVSRIARLFLVKNASAYADHLRKLADTERLVRVIVSHHETIDRSPAHVLRDVAATL